VRLVSIAQNAPGPAAVARLVQRGATAIKVEPPWGDALEALSKSWYDELHAGVRVERLDLKSRDGMTALKALLGACDLFLASQRPAALARLGLDAASLARDYPRLRHLNIVGDTAAPEHAGHDLTYQAAHGLLRREMPLTLIADLAGAERAYAAAIELMQDPPGSHRVVGLANVMHDLAAPLRHGLTARGGPLGGGNPAYGLYAARQGLVAVAALEPHFRARLFAALGLADGSDPSAAFTTKTALEWEAWARPLDLPIVAVREIRGQVKKFAPDEG
jgi:crotonobetainyl-CoA:carnitine CoA-transferase CaiB-like acyl-CoA transferase